MRLDGKRALVTGSSRGIGEGADVIINYMGKGHEAEGTRAEAVKTGRRVAVIQADVSLPTKAREFDRPTHSRTWRARYPGEQRRH
jgi:NAD(P)-dependent dehydrogenase (short-subunit alcohol dehydrogenase family)